MRRNCAAVVAAMVLLAGCAAGTVPGERRPAESVTAPASGPFSSVEFGPREEDDAAPPDPPTDRRGWESGVWHNESVDLDRSDGLSSRELEAVLYRTMARVELVRDVEFRSPVSVTVVSRSSFQSGLSGGEGPPTGARQFANARFEALFMVDESTDATEVTRANTGVSVGGFYNPREDHIVLIVEDFDSPDLSEAVLAHELVHAYQDRQLPSPREVAPEASSGAVTGLIEGDAELAESLYRQRCRTEWTDCLLPSPGGGGGGGRLASVGPFLISIQPYSDGPGFVKRVKDREGWDGVDRLYRAPPVSTEQIIHPEAYPEDGPTTVVVTDRSSDAWRQLRVRGGPASETVGEAGVFAMFLLPSLEGEGDRLIPREAFFNRDERGDLDELDPFNYSHPYSAGWDGDQFVAYENDRGELAYVWKLEWDTAADAREFLAGYERLLRLRGASPVAGREGTWRIPEGDGFADAFYVRRQGGTVVIVNAPTVADLGDVRAGAAPAA